jgi:hypothetical protein
MIKEQLKWPELTAQVQFRQRTVMRLHLQKQNQSKQKFHELQCTAVVVIMGSLTFTFLLVVSFRVLLSRHHEAAERAEAADTEPTGDAALMEAVRARHCPQRVAGLVPLDAHRALVSSSVPISRPR